MELIGSIRRLARKHPGTIRKSWEYIGKTRQSPQEIAFRVAEKIESLRAGKRLEWRLPLPEWMTDGLVESSCAEFGFSRWDSDDLEDPKYLKLKENHLETSGPNSVKEWLEILEKQMLCRRGKHYYVREGALTQDLSNGMTDARNALKGLLLSGNKTIDNSSLPPGLAAIASMVTGGIDPRIIDIADPAIKAEITKGIEALDLNESIRTGLLDRIELSEEWDSPISVETLEEVCRTIGTSLVAVGPHPETLLLVYQDHPQSLGM
jgi:hypothetical protein